VDAWIIQSKHAMEYKKLKDNYSSSLKSMSKTISPFFYQTYHDSQFEIEFMSSAASMFIT
jgi:hypothetical protein